MADTFGSLIENPLFFIISFIPGLLMYILIFVQQSLPEIYSGETRDDGLRYLRGSGARLYDSPLVAVQPGSQHSGRDGNAGTDRGFNKMHGLDQGYLTQLWNNIKGIAYFDLGKSFSGNEEITSSIARKFPITLTLTVIS